MINMFKYHLLQMDSYYYVEQQRRRESYNGNLLYALSTMNLDVVVHLPILSTVVLLKKHLLPIT